MLGIECLLLIPFIIRSGKLEKSGKWVFYYLIISVASGFGSMALAYLLKNNLWFYNSMYFIQFVILSCYFHEVIKYQFVKIVIKIMVPLMFAIVVLDYVWLEGPTAYNSYAISLETFVQMTYGVIFFWQLLRDEELIKKSIFVNILPDFWYNGGLFVYHCGFFLFSLSYNLRLFTGAVLLKSTSDSILAITFIAGIIQLILLYIGLLKEKRIRL
jgi:hypothetical protein